MTAVAVTVTRTLERVALLRDRAAAVVMRYTMTAKTIENVRAICAGKTGRVTHPRTIIEHLLFAWPTVLFAMSGICYLESTGEQQGTANPLNSHANSKYRCVFQERVSSICIRFQMTRNTHKELRMKALKSMACTTHKM